jgi:DNA-directed RNA polymerase subunit RPC12/RpoP
MPTCDTCGTESTKVYRCSSCGADLAGDNEGSAIQ